MNTDRLISTFFELVKIPSENPNDKDFVSYLEKVFLKEGAVKTIYDDFGNLVVKFNAKNSTKTDPIAFCCHADTVKPGIGIEPFIDKENGVITSSNLRMELRLSNSMISVKLPWSIAGSFYLFMS